MTDVNQETAQKLKNYIEKIERLEDDKAELMRGIKDVFDEAKAVGFDAKIMKQVIKLRKMKREEYLEQEHILSTYLTALGME